MKINKSQLKAIVKECLIEILNDGLAGSLVQSAQTNQKQTMNDSKVKKTPQTILPEQKKLVKMAAAGNPVLESIMADTLKTTYVTQSEAERNGIVPKSGIEAIVDQSTPEQLFGDEVASKWLAIMDNFGND